MSSPSALGIKPPGSAGSKVDTTTNGGTSAFSSNTDTVSITVNAVNDAPTLDTSESPALTAIDEDTAAPSNGNSTAGTLVSDLLAGFDDVDSAASEGIAITAVNTTNGSLKYSTDAGANWSDVGSVSNSSALLLASDANTRLAFTPSANYNGSISDVLTFRAWDQTSGSAGSKVDTTTNGGTSAFSSNTDTVSITVNAVNDAPTLDTSASPALTAIDEDTTAPANGNSTAGTLVSDLLAGFDDVDSGASEGIAITAVNTTNGSLKYSTDAGANWSDVGSVSNSSALLLASDANTRLAFTPSANYNGSISDVLTFRAWDQTSGSAGSKVDTTTNGGTSAFSSNTDTVSITVNAVNDAPTLDTSESPALTAIDEDTLLPQTETPQLEPSSPLSLLALTMSIPALQKASPSLLLIPLTGHSNTPPTMVPTGRMLAPSQTPPLSFSPPTPILGSPLLPPPTTTAPSRMSSPSALGIKPPAPLVPKLTPQQTAAHLPSPPTQIPSPSPSMPLTTLPLLIPPSLRL